MKTCLSITDDIWLQEFLFSTQGVLCEWL